MLTFRPEAAEAPLLRVTYEEMFVDRFSLAEEPDGPEMNPEKHQSKYSTTDRLAR